MKIASRPIQSQKMFASEVVWHASIGGRASPRKRSSNEAVPDLTS